MTPLRKRNIITSISQWVGSSAAVMFATITLLLYLVIGTFIGFTDKYNLIVNTIMSAISYVFLFVIQYTQDLHIQTTQYIREHDSKAIHVKLDEIIHALRKADNKIMGAQHGTDEELEQIARRHGTHHKDHNV